ncbi:hypothetical protein [Micrococcus sp. KRD070]|uniref:hypothetical protein n=1 Tax=Micrococcus sp. KRD070 TaxID=2729719 RepID=UPI001F49E024|nr:hypothetical protein [Micrococcus sp. KRD070]
MGGAGIGLAAGFGADDGAAGLAADRGFGVAAGAAEDCGFGVAAGFGDDAGVALEAGFVAGRGAAGAGVFGACFVSAGAAEAFSCVRAAMAFSCSGNASPTEFRTGAESDAAFCAARSLASRAAWSRREPPP